MHRTQKQNDAAPTYLPTNQPNQTINPQSTQPNQTKPKIKTNQRLGNIAAHHSLQMADVKLNSFIFIFVEIPVPKYSVVQECTNLLPVSKFQVPQA